MKTIKNGGDGMTNSVDKIQKLLSLIRNAMQAKALFPSEGKGHDDDDDDALQVSKQRPIFNVERHSESIFPAWLCVVLKF